MYTFIGQKSTLAAGSLLFCTIVAGIMGATNAPGAVPVAQTEIVTVNPVNKGDRLPISPRQEVRPALSPSSTDGAKPSLKHPPIGCDPAFSPVADPARANIYKRCTV